MNRISVSLVLIETYWNVNASTGCPVCSGALCINRNILECKYQLYRVRNWSDWGINRNILECKDTLTERVTLRGDVLIETYWNVKVDHLGIFNASDLVLIETYWNVKQHNPQKVRSPPWY